LKKDWKLVKTDVGKMMKYQARSALKGIIEDSVFSGMECVIDMKLINREDFSTLVENHLDEIVAGHDFNNLRSKIIELFTEKVQISELKSKEKVIKQFTEFIQGFSISFSEHIVEF